MKICIFNLGCKVNQYENDVLVNELSKDHEVITTLDKADYYIINTCAVTNEGEKKSRQVLAKINKLNPDAPIFVCGCAVQKNAAQFEGKKNVVGILGSAGKYDIPKLISAKSGSGLRNLSDEYEDGISLSTRTRSYLKIQDGCNNFCSYCIIPYLRGRSRSREENAVIGEAKILAKKSKEIVLTGINLSDYKIDGKSALVYIVREIAKVVTARIRLSSLEIGIITKENLVELSKIKNFCPHFHLSLQSGSNAVLKHMNRHYTREEYIKKCKLIYKYFKDASITTDVIVGYPTETEEDFLNTLDLIKKVGFYSVHYFAYSMRSGTVASKLPILNGDIIKEREERLQQTMLLTQSKFLNEHLEQNLKVLFEDKEENFYVGYSQNYIKCYSNGKNLKNKLVNVKPIKIYKDGFIVEVIKNN